MPAVTQLTPNFLGGVSKQNDDKKLEGQLTECVNGYPDPTFGLLKRPGLTFTNTLKKANGDVFTESELEGAVWFFIERDAAGSYVGCIKGSNIYVWTAADGTWCTVTNNASGYLSGTNYHFRSIQDTTIITNRSKITAMETPGSFTANSVATIKLITLVSGNDYVVTIQGESSTSTAQSSTTFDDMLLYDSGSINTNHHIVDDIVKTITDQQAAANADFAGTWCIEGYTNSLVIKRFSTATNQVLTNYEHADGTFTDDGIPSPFTIEVKGGISNDAIEVFQDNVVNVSKLPAESFHGHNVEILNSDGGEDNYYVEYIAYNGEYGRGYFKETVARNVSAGFDATTMPHELVNTGPTAFTFDAIDWIAREAGDNDTSPIPAFIGDPITSTFYYNNRFGILSTDNINFSVANDPYNFFVKSALTQIDSDPIDLNVASVRPVTLSDVLPSPQGLLVFSERQQFQIFTTDGSTLTPTSTIVRAISNYEMNTDIAPADVGTTAVFVSNVSGYSKLFTLQLRDVEQNPVVVDISKVVLEWIPETIDNLTVSPQNSVIMLIDRGTSYLYLYRYYNNGEKDLFQAWTKWELPGTIQTAKILNDSVIVVSQHESEYTIGRITLDEIPSGDVVATANGINGNACLDMATRPVSPNNAVVTLTVLDGGTGYSDAYSLATVGGTGTGLNVDIITDGGVVTEATVHEGAAGSGYTVGDVVTITYGGFDATLTVSKINDVVYDSTNDLTKIYVPYTPFAQTNAMMLLTVPTADDGTDDEIDADAGYYATAYERTESGTNYRYFEVKGDFSNYADGIVVGYPYDFEATLPRFYFRRDQNTTAVSYTHLTLPTTSRV